MPFTPAHMAAALPFLPVVRRARVPASGLVIGTMIPDLPYFVPPLRIDAGFTHSVAGVFTVDLVMGLVCVLIWHVVLAPAAVAVAPDAVRARVRPPVGSFSARTGAGVVAGLLAGALTHVLWDSFTHVGRWGPEHIAWLAAVHGSVEGYRWAQYASGILGLVALGAWSLRWLRDTAPRPVPPAVRGRTAVWAAILAGMALGAAAGLAGGLVMAIGARQTVFRVAVGSGGTAALVALVCAVLLRPRLRAARAGTASG